MRVTVIGSHLCPDTLYALNRLSEAKAEIDFKNLSASLSDLLCPGGRDHYPGSGRGIAIIHRSA